MSRAPWLALGVGVGFAAAHVVNKIPAGRAFLERVDARLTEFIDAVADGYRGRDLELRGVHSDPTASADLPAASVEPGPRDRPDSAPRG